MYLEADNLMSLWVRESSDTPAVYRLITRHSFR